MDRAELYSLFEDWDAFWLEVSPREDWDLETLKRETHQWLRRIREQYSHWETGSTSEKKELLEKLAEATPFLEELDERDASLLEKCEPYYEEENLESMPQELARSLMDAYLQWLDQLCEKLNVAPSLAESPSGATREQLSAFPKTEETKERDEENTDSTLEPSPVPFPKTPDSLAPSPTKRFRPPNFPGESPFFEEKLFRGRAAIPGLFGDFQRDKSLFPLPSPEEKVENFFKSSSS